MIYHTQGKTLIMLGHELVQIRVMKTASTMCIGLAYGDNSRNYDPEVILSFSTGHSIDMMIEALESARDRLFDDPNEIELEYE